MSNIINSCLTISEKTIIELKYKRGKTFAEIAQEIDRLEGSVKAAEGKAIDKICESIEIETL